MPSWCLFMLRILIVGFIQCFSKQDIAKNILSAHSWAPGVRMVSMCLKVEQQYQKKKNGDAEAGYMSWLAVIHSCALHQNSLWRPFSKSENQGIKSISTARGNFEGCHANSVDLPLWMLKLGIVKALRICFTAFSGAAHSVIILAGHLLHLWGWLGLAKQQNLGIPYPIFVQNVILIQQSGLAGCCEEGCLATLHWQSADPAQTQTDTHLKEKSSWQVASASIWKRTV